MDFKKKLTNANVEVAFLVILAGLLFFLVNGAVYDYRISHEYPYSYFASDGFAYLFLTQHVYETGSQAYHPFYSAAGYEDVVWQHGLTIYAVSAIFARVSGIAVHDSLYLMATAMLVLNALAIYILVRRFSQKVAMLSAGLFAFIAVKNFYVTYLWGQLGAVSGMLFMTAMVWSVARHDLRKSAVLMALFFSATIFAHIPEFIFGALAAGFIFIVHSVAKRRLQKEMLKKLAVAGVFTLIITSYYLSTFFFGVYKNQATSQPFVTPEEAQNGFRVVFFSDWGWIPIALMILGMCGIAFYFLKGKEVDAVLLSALLFFILGFSNYFGLGFRAFHIRAFWPFYLAPLFGLGVYLLLSQAMKSIPLTVAGIAGLAIFGVIAYAYYSPIHGPGIMNQYSYDTFQWLGKNTGLKEKVFFFYGDGYDQNARIVPRLTYVVRSDSYAETVQKGAIQRQYVADLVTLTNGDLMYWKGFMQPGYYFFEDKIVAYTKPYDLCMFDYFVFDRQSGYAQGFAQLNMFVRDIFLRQGMQEVHSNPLTSIVKNNKPGGECFEETPLG